MATRKTANTPDGRMPVAGTLRPSGAWLTDFLVAFLFVAPSYHFFDVENNPVVLWSLLVVVAIPALSFRGVLPSLGRWALGLKWYRGDVVDDYVGRGTLYVYEDLPSREYTRRTIIATIVFGILVGINYLVVIAFPSDSI